MEPTVEPRPRSRRPLGLLMAGAAAAVVAGVGLAFLLTSGGRGEKTPPPAASQAGLVIEQGPAEARLDPAKPLRCFVGGQLVGELSLSDCARRNGVATDALDVGVDPSGALAAAQQAGPELTPLPPQAAATPAEAAAPAEPAPPPAADTAAAACWRYNHGQWRKLGDTDLNGCVQTLFAGRCEKPGSASYGRFGQQTVRLVAGKAEISNDNQTFRTLANQTPGCSLPAVG